MTDKQNYEIAAQSILGRKQKGPSKGRKFFDLAFAFMENLKDTKTKQAQEKTATRFNITQDGIVNVTGNLFKKLVPEN